MHWWCRYDNALEKANYASLALKQEQEQGAAQAEEDAEDDEELQVGSARLVSCSLPHPSPSCSIGMDLTRYSSAFLKG